MKLRLVIILFLSLSACGSALDLSFDSSIMTQLPPYINRVDPAAGRPGDTVTVYGFGFSAEAPNNIVTFGDDAVSATAYQLVPLGASPEIESLTVTVPAAATAGAVSVYAIVFDNISNSNVQFTVNP